MPPPTNHFAPAPVKISRALDLTPVISVTALAGVPAFVRHAFGQRLLTRANRAAMLDIEAIEDQDCFIPHATMTTFIDAVARFAKEESIGLLLAPHLSITNYGCWGQYLLGAPTLGGAIRRGIATIGFHSKGDALSITLADDRAQINYASAAKGQEGYQHVACGAAGVILSVCRQFLPAEWRPNRIALDFPRPARAAIYEDAFKCPVAFDAPRISVYLDADHLLAEPTQQPARLLVTVDDVARARVACSKMNHLGDVIAQQVWSQVLAGQVSIESAARSINTSVRTLQRELNREGTDF
ncbi:MAG: AraC family transcriptional regulator, partial [Alphaproteobacteria bacterium]|nr:AraC family transcriptional regulator [Alphaproteobacteria bacterium]